MPKHVCFLEKRCKDTAFFRLPKISAVFFAKKRKKTPFFISLAQNGTIFVAEKCAPEKRTDRKRNSNIIMNKETAGLVDRIVDAIQDKKGHSITVADVSAIDGTICQAFVICQGNSPAQIDAIARSVGDKLRMGSEDIRPLNVVGLRQCRWVAMDYVDVLVHIFLPDERRFYNLENLWADAVITDIPDLD